MEKYSTDLLIATGIFPPDIGGPATYSKLLLEELPKQGISVKVLNFGEYRPKPRLVRHFLYAWQVIKLGRQARVIYAQDPVSVGLPVMLACFFLRRNYVLKIVGDYAWEQGSQRFGVGDLLDDFSAKKTGYGLAVRILKLIQKKVADRAQKIIVPSNYLKKIVGNWGINPDKIKVIYNSFDTPGSLPNKEELRLELGWSGRIFISVGRLVPWKGFDLLVGLMPEIFAKFPDAKFLIVGSGPDNLKLKEQIERLNLTGKIILTGSLSHEQVLKYLKASDLFVLNTSYEGFSHQLLEALWCEVPIITTAVGGNVELIKNGETGWLVSYNNKEEFKRAINEVFDNQEKTETLVKNGKELLVNFGQVEMLNNLIKEIL